MRDFFIEKHFCVFFLAKQASFSVFLVKQTSFCTFFVPFFVPFLYLFSTFFACFSVKQTFFRETNIFCLGERGGGGGGHGGELDVKTEENDHSHVLQALRTFANFALNN